MRILLFCIVTFISFSVFARKPIAEVPFKLIEGKIVMTVAIEGSKYSFVFDSGAMSVISDSLNNRIEHEKLHPRFIATDAANNIDTLDICRIPAINIATLSIQQPVFACANLDELNKTACIGIDGIFGANLMKNLIWSIDFCKERILVYDKAPYSRKDVSVPLSLAPFTAIPSLNLLAGGDSVTCILDLGATDALTLASTEVNLLSAKSLGKFVRLKKGTAFASEQLVLDTFDIYRASVALGSLKSTVQITLLKSTENLLGTSFFSHCNPILDFKNKRLVLSHSLKKRSFDGASSVHNVTAGVYSSIPIVYVQNIDTLPDETFVGKEVITVNGQAVESYGHISPCDFNLLLSRSGTVLGLENGKTVLVENVGH